MQWRQRTLRTTLCYLGLLFANELGSNIYGLYGKFASEIYANKVVSAFADTVVPALRLLAPEVAIMLAVTALLTAPIALAWAAASVLALDAAAGRFGVDRARRIAFWSVSGIAFFNVYYSVHSAVFPYSTLARSPLAALSGALDLLMLPGAGQIAVTLGFAVVVIGVATVAALQSKTFCASLGASAVALTLFTSGYSWLTGVGTVKPFEQPGSVVMLGLDSFQLNRLPVGGSPHDDAPNVNAFLEESFRFDNAWTPFARTYPSWVSILTGRYPVHHGVRFNLVGDEYLAADNRYLAAELRDAGYATFHATDETRFSNIRPHFGYDEMLHPPMGLTDFIVGGFFDFSTANFVRQSHLGHDLFPAIRNNRAATSYNPKVFTRNVIRQLNRLPRDRPVFVTMHLCGDHWPFSVPMPYFYRTDDVVRNSIQMVDDQVGELLGYLRSSGLLASSTTIMLSDHGDGWSGDPEDSANTHGDDLEHPWANKIVLAVQSPAIEPGVSTDLVRSIDLYPTVLELAGAALPPAGVDGASLLPLTTQGAHAPRTLFAESGFDKVVARVQRLVQKYAGWYGFDPETRLISLKSEPYERLMKRKSYMMVRGDRRLVVSPVINSVRLFSFDPMTGQERRLPRSPANEAEKEAMLRELVAHYGLDHAEIFDIALRRPSS